MTIKLFQKENTTKTHSFIKDQSINQLIMVLSIPDFRQNEPIATYTHIHI